MGFTYTRVFTDTEEKILRDRLVVEPIDWINDAIRGKLSNALTSLAIRRRQELVNSGATTMPARDIDLAINAFADPKYKDGKQRNERTGPPVG